MAEMKIVGAVQPAPVTLPPAEGLQDIITLLENGDHRFDQKKYDQWLAGERRPVCPECHAIYIAQALLLGVKYPPVVAYG